MCRSVFRSFRPDPRKPYCEFTPAKRLCCVSCSDSTVTTTVLYILLLAAVVVAVDFLFFKNAFWERLTVNIGIVLIFAAFYFRFLKRP